MAPLSTLTKSILYQRTQLSERRFCVGALAVKSHPTTRTRGQHQQAHNALAIDLFPIFFNEDIALKAPSEFNKHR